MSTQTPVNVDGSPDSADKSLVIREVIPGLVTFSIPFSRGGFPIGGRSTAVKLATSDIFVYVSTPPTTATKATLEKMGGTVKWLVTPDGEHGMNIEAFQKAYPEAQAIGVTRLKEQKPNVRWAGLFGSGGDSQTYGFESEISLHSITAHVNHELVAIHHPSGTLLEGDMLFNLPPTEQYSRSGGLPTLFKLFGSGKSLSPGGAVHNLVLGQITKDKAKMKTELQPIMSAKWDRVIPCHGDVIETGGRKAWDKLWAQYA